jgi:hypothetical protein
MTINYPLDIPSSIGFSEVELTARNAVSVSQSPFTFATQVHSYPGQMWQANLTIPPVRRDLAAPWKAFLTALKGPTGSFLLGDPDYARPQGLAATFPGNPMVTDQIGQNITVTGASPNKTGWLLAGDYIQIGVTSTATLHQVLQDVNTDGSGTAQLDVWPGLRYSRTASLTLTNPKGVFKLADSSTTWSINNESAYGISFTAFEDISV